MSAHMNFVFLVDRKLWKRSLADVISSVGVVTLPGNSIKFLPTVSQVQ